ncbi:hypothetical protein AC578_7163 [Pseudocercospora eumusae]|uniref:Uncharacterized protein n=1 Tax=Pseudocercospora eumusae TaxID=321146 RepID=A0A139HX74_9PEZI|nr:hypothetical protein AC578_7163 [Pseudocercospora eumusae]
MRYAEDTGVKRGDVNDIDSTPLLDSKIFSRINSAMNQKSAKPPTFNAAYATLSIDVEVLDGFTKLMFKAAYHEISLQPWQVTGVAYMKIMMLSPTRFAIMGHDRYTYSKIIPVVYQFHLQHDTADRGATPYHCEENRAMIALALP